MERTAKIISIQKPFELKPYNKAQLCELYEVSRYIMNKMLAEIKDKVGKRVGYCYSIKQMEIIVETYGIPGSKMNQAA